MASKHDQLTKKEFKSYKVDDRILNVIKEFEESHPELDKNEIKILDWGCGRGRTVLKLLEMGYTAYGIDIDQDAMKNGYPLFNMFDYNPEKHLLLVKDLKNFPDKFFHVIVTEQVFEHVEDIQTVINEQGRLTAPSGYGFHSFPASKMIVEVHLWMPLVHWLPKNKIRRYWIAGMLILSFKPKQTWPETVGKSFWETVDVYYDYLNQKTFYRDIRKLVELFQEWGFEVIYMNQPPKKSFINLLPDYFVRNGFPLRTGRMVVKKVEN